MTLCLCVAALRDRGGAVISRGRCFRRCCVGGGVARWKAELQGRWRYDNPGGSVIFVALNGYM